MKFLILTAFIFMLAPNQKEYLITDFQSRNLEWFIFNDGVMGGLSESELDVSSGLASYSGNVSLENYGGFASVRAPFNQSTDENFNKLKLRLKGDGKSYSFRLRKDNRFDGIAYKLDFDTEANSWQEITLPLEDFIGTYRGRTFSEERILDSRDISQIGILIGDKQKGLFAIQLDWIKLIK